MDAGDAKAEDRCPWSVPLARGCSSSPADTLSADVHVARLTLNQGRAPLQAVTWHTSLFSPFPVSKFMGITLSPLPYLHKTNHSNIDECKLPLGRSHHATESEQKLKPAALWTACGAANPALMGFLLFCPKAAELSWIPTLWGSFFSQDLVCTFGITYWKDLKGFLPLIVACENSISQTRCRIYSRLHALLWFWEETQKKAFSVSSVPFSPAFLPSVFRTWTHHSWIVTEKIRIAWKRYIIAVHVYCSEGCFLWKNQTLPSASALFPNGDTLPRGLTYHLLWGVFPPSLSRSEQGTPWDVSCRPWHKPSMNASCILFIWRFEHHLA